MEKSRKKLLLRFVFWGVLLAAPVVFVMMIFVYLNAYVTADRVNFVVIPVFEAISGRSVQIETTEAHVGYTSSLEFSGVHFSPHTEQVNTEGISADTHIDKLYFQFKPLTMFTRTFQIDSLIIDGFRGILKHDPDRSFSRLEWTADDESRRIELSIDHTDLDNIHIKSLCVYNASIHYVHTGFDVDYIVDDFYKEIELESLRVMNIMLVKGHAGGILKDPKTGKPFTDISLSGRLQINFDDGTFVIRGGTLGIGDKKFTFNAFSSRTEDIHGLSLIFDERREIIETAIEKFPHKLGQWFLGNLSGSKYRVQIIYAGEDGSDQT